MAARKDFVLRGAGVLVVAGVLAGGGAYVIQDDPPPEAGTANIWVDDGGGACAGGRSSTLLAFADAGSPDRICGTFDTAWDAANAGDTIGVDDGTYNDQTITGDKASDTTFVGIDQDTVILTGELIHQANHTVMDTMTFDQGSSHGWGVHFESADDVTWRDFIARGEYIGIDMLSDSSRFTWDGGSLGHEDDTPGLRCDGSPNFDQEPIQIKSGSGHVLSDLVVWPGGGGEAPCGGDGFHEEDIRIEADNVTIERVLFEDGTDVNRNAGSGKIFLSGTPTGIVIRNNVFGPGNPDSFNAIDSNVTSCSVTLAYNTFYDKGQSLGGCSVTSIHNLGPSAPGVPMNGVLSAGNAAIDAAAATCSSDTGGHVDYLGQTRPFGSACDKGAYEYQGG